MLPKRWSGKRGLGKRGVFLGLGKERVLAILAFLLPPPSSTEYLPPPAAFRRSTKREEEDPLSRQGVQRREGGREDPFKERSTSETCQEFL